MIFSILQRAIEKPIEHLTMAWFALEWGTLENTSKLNIGTQGLVVKAIGF